MTKFSGIVSALLSPFKASGELNPAMLRELVKFQIDAGVAGLWLCGGSAEVSLLSISERRTITEVVTGEVAGEINVFVHVGHNVTQAACELARHAASAGASAIACFPPAIPKPSAEAVRTHYRAVARACEGLPFLAYHVPVLTGVSVDSELTATLLDIENFAGIKHADYNLYDLRNTAELAPDRLSILEGYDEVLLAALVMGADGGIGLNYNYTPQTFLDIYTKFRSGDIAGAQEAQFRINRMIRSILRFGAYSTMKEAMRLLGYDCGICRPPIPPLSDEQRAQIKQELRRFGVIE